MIGGITPTPKQPTFQISTRVSDSAYRTLQVGLVVEGADNMQELLRPVIEAYVAQLAAEPEVTEMLEQIEKYRARKTGVTQMPGASKRKRASG